MIDEAFSECLNDWERFLNINGKRPAQYVRDLIMFSQYLLHRYDPMTRYEVRANLKDRGYI